MRLPCMNVRLVLFTLATLLTVILAPLPGYAATVTLTVNTINPTMIEGTLSPFSFTLSNSSGSPIEPFPPLVLSPSYSVTFVSGDPTDQLQAHFGAPLFSAGTCTGMLASGSTCTFITSFFQQAPATGETENTDSGIDSVTLDVAYALCDPLTGGCSTPPLFATTTFDVTVTDTPEPSSLLLLGSGAAALLGFFRRRLPSA